MEIEKQIYRFNWYFAVLLIVATVVDIILVVGFAFVLRHVKPLL